MASLACHLRKHVLRCLMAAAGLMSFAMTDGARAQIGSARYSSIVVDVKIFDVL